MIAALPHLGELVAAESLAADEVELARLSSTLPPAGGLELVAVAQVGRPREVVVDDVRVGLGVAALGHAVGAGRVAAADQPGLELVLPAG